MICTIKCRLLHLGVEKKIAESCSGLSFSRQGSTPTPWAQGLRDQIQKWLPDPQNPLFLGFSVPRAGLRPWSQTMVSEGARPWGRGRSGDCEFCKPVKGSPNCFLSWKTDQHGKHRQNNTRTRSHISCPLCRHVVESSR